MFRNILCVLLFVMAIPAFAGFDEGLTAYNKKEYLSALQEFKPLAEQGSADAQNALGVMYENGFGVEKNDGQAIRWYRQAAEQGNENAQFNLGVLFDNRQDYTEAVRWYRKAAEQGNKSGQARLGSLYVLGQGVAADKVQAIQWFRKAAEQGQAGAQYFLGFAYSGGYGLSKDEVQAVYWYRKAVEQGHADAQFNLGVMYASGLGVTKDLEKAMQLYALSAKQGNEPAKNNLADLQKKLLCSHKASTLLFGEALNCTDKTAMRLAGKQAGATATREDNGYWYDLYDSSALLDGTSELAIAYIGEKFAKTYYKFDAMVDAHKVVEVRNMVVSKYGKPATSEGNPSLGPVSYTWKLKDGIRLVVKRDWPDTTVYLEYIHLANYAAMEAEQERQKRVEEDGKRSKQSKAF